MGIFGGNSQSKGDHRILVPGSSFGGGGGGAGGLLSGASPSSVFSLFICRFIFFSLFGSVLLSLLSAFP